MRTTVPRLSRFAVDHLLLLPLGGLLALVWVNIAPESYYPFTFAIAFVVNDIAMALFFAVIMKEIVEATAPDGVLHPWRRAMLPVVAAMAAAAVTAFIYAQMSDALDEPMLSQGWPVSLATDLAISYFVARIIFKRHPVIPFLLLFGIASDGLGFLALELFNPVQGTQLAAGMLMVAAGIGVAAGLRRRRVRTFWPYLIAAGGLSWFGMFWSGWHPALALVPVMPFLPHAARDPGFFVDALPDAKDTLSQFEIWWKYPAQVALFLFGLVNASVPIGALEAGVWALPAALIVGKPTGVLVGAGLALLMGLHLPHRIGWRELIVGGLIATMGFSVGLFFSSALFPPGQLRSETSMGVLLSLAAAPLALVAARLLGVGRFSQR